MSGFDNESLLKLNSSSYATCMLQTKYKIVIQSNFLLKALTKLLTVYLDLSQAYYFLPTLAKHLICYWSYAGQTSSTFTEDATKTSCRALGDPRQNLVLD